MYYLNNRLGIFIKQRRNKKSLSLREFGNLCGISHTHIDSIEKGKDFRTGKPVRITNETLEKLANVLNVSCSYLLSLSLNKDDNSIQKDVEKTIEILKGGE